ncbi:MAG TPA: hypothetical protein PLG34_12275, partial [Spirochaetota bacterium]|nr:hypothetical protein [Spirochaetota bacterium]
IPITLSGHSHGGNIMIMVADKLISSGFKVKQIITLNTPVRPEYKLKNRIRHINLFSFLDWVQIAGGWDFDNCICDEDFRGPAKRMFNNAINICIDSKINMEDRLNFIRTQRNLSVSIFLQHNITMWSKFVIKCLGD